MQVEPKLNMPMQKHCNFLGPEILTCKLLYTMHNILIFFQNKFFNSVILLYGHVAILQVYIIASYIPCSSMRSDSTRLEPIMLLKLPIML